MSKTPVDVERLSTLTREVEFERNKATSALSLCGQLRIEISVLNDQAIAQSNDIHILNENCSHFQSELSMANQSLTKSMNELQARDEELASKNNDIQSLEEQVHKLEHNYEELQKEFEHKQSDYSTLLVQFETIQSRAHAGEETIARMNEEIFQLRSHLDNVERDKLNLLEDTTQQQNDLEEMSVELEDLRSLKGRFESLTASDNDLRVSYDNSVDTCEKMRLELRTMINKYDDQTALLEQLDVIGNTVMNERDNLSAQVVSLEHSYAELSERIEAEVEAGNAAKEHAESVNYGRALLEQQLIEVRVKFEEVAALNAELHSEKSILSEENACLKRDFSEARDKIKEQRAMLAQVEVDSVSKHDLDAAHKELLYLKRQQLERDMEESSEAFVSHKVANGMEQSRLVFEKINEDLKFEVDRLNSELRGLETRYHNAQLKASRLDRVEQELEMFKGVSTNTMSAKSEANRRADESHNLFLLTQQEVLTLKREVHQLQSDLDLSRSEVENLKQGSVSLMQLSKDYNSRQLEAEKRTAELKKLNSNLEIRIEEQRQQREYALMDVDRSVSAAQDMRRQVSELKAKEKQLSTLEVQYRTTSEELTSLKLTSSQQVRDLSGQVDALRSTNVTQQTELQSLKDRCAGQKVTIDNLNTEVAQLVARVDSVSNEKERFKREVQQSESLRVENELTVLRHDIQATADEWKEMERERAQKDKALSALQTETNKERAAKELLKYNSQLLEERLRVVTQELAVFKSLDVYHSSMHVGLQSYRESKTTGPQQQLLASSQQSISNGSYAFNSSAVKSLHGQQALFRGSSTAKGPMALTDMNSSRYEHHLQEADDRHVPSSLSGGAVTLSHQSLSAMRQGIPPPPPPSSRGGAAATHDQSDNRSVLSDLPREFDLPAPRRHGGREDSSDDDQQHHEQSHQQRSQHRAHATITPHHHLAERNADTRSGAVHEYKSSDQYQRQLSSARPHQPSGSVTGDDEDDGMRQSRMERQAAREKMLRDKVLKEKSNGDVAGAVSAAERARSLLSSSRAASLLAAATTHHRDDDSDDDASQSSRFSSKSQHHQLPSQPERGRATQRHGEKAFSSSTISSSSNAPVTSRATLPVNRTTERGVAPVQQSGSSSAITAPISAVRTANLFTPSAADLARARRSANK